MLQLGSFMRSRTQVSPWAPSTTCFGACVHVCGCARLRACMGACARVRACDLLPIVGHCDDKAHELLAAATASSKLQEATFSEVNDAVTCSELTDEQLGCLLHQWVASQVKPLHNGARAWHSHTSARTFPTHARARAHAHARARMHTHAHMHARMHAHTHAHTH